ncbi:MAG: DUF3175 domain-containing protein [Vulcanococcus sp.]
MAESSRGWVAKVRQRPPALDLEPGLFTWNDPLRIARSLWQSARQSQRRRRSVYGSAMSMLCLYINRAGKTLDPHQRAILEEVKQELRRLAAAGPMA